MNKFRGSLNKLQKHYFSFTLMETHESLFYNPFEIIGKGSI